MGLTARNLSLRKSCNVTKLSSKLEREKQSYDKPRQRIKKQRHHFADKGLYSQSYGFSSGHIRMWELGHKEGREPKNWYFQTVVLEKTFVSLLDKKGDQTSQYQEINTEYSLEGLMLKLQYFGHLTQRTDSLEKTLMLGKIEGRRRRGRQRVRWLDGPFFHAAQNRCSEVSHVYIMTYSSVSSPS